MPLELLEQSPGKIAHVRMSGRISTEEYERYLADLESRIQQYGKIRILGEIEDYHGLDAGAWWEDRKFRVQHMRDIERIAVVGGPKWWKAIGEFLAPLVHVEARFLEAGQEEEARRWIERD